MTTAHTRLQYYWLKSDRPSATMIAPNHVSNFCGDAYVLHKYTHEKGKQNCHLRKWMMVGLHTLLVRRHGGKPVANKACPSSLVPLFRTLGHETNLWLPLGSSYICRASRNNFVLLWNTPCCIPCSLVYLIDWYGLGFRYRRVHKERTCGNWAGIQ